VRAAREKARFRLHVVLQLFPRDIVRQVAHINRAAIVVAAAAVAATVAAAAVRRGPRRATLAPPAHRHFAETARRGARASWSVEYTSHDLTSHSQVKRASKQGNKAFRLISLLA
jgi:hypothetical protein